MSISLKQWERLSQMREASRLYPWRTWRYRLAMLCTPLWKADADA